MDNEMGIAPVEPVSKNVICEERPFVFNGKRVLGYFPIVPGPDPQFESVYVFQEPTYRNPDGSPFTIRCHVLFTAKTIEEAFVKYDEEAAKAKDAALSELRKQMLASAGPLPPKFPGMGRSGRNGFPQR
jgi:hypothetical protein